VAFEQMMFGLLLVVFGFRALLSPAQNDTYWTLRAGADIWRTHHVSLVDSYSSSVAGAPWPNHEWLWQVFVYGAYRAGGMPLVTVAVTVLVLLAIGLISRLMVGPPVTRFVLLAIGVSLVSFIWLLRPQIVTLLALPLLATLLARDLFWPIPVLFLVWANAHGGVALGGLVLIAATLAAALRWRWVGRPDDRRRATALAIVLPLSGLATCATPLRVHLIGFVWGSMTRLHAAHVVEWGPTLPNGAIGVLYWLAALAFLALLFRRRSALAAGSWADWMLVAAALALLGPGFRSIRNYAPFATLATPAASRLLGDRFRFAVPWRRAPLAASPDHPRLNVALVALFALPALAVVVAAYAGPHRWLFWRPLADGAIAAVRACPGNVFNHYNDGGPLIWFVPEKPVLVDSRQDPYPMPLLQEVAEVEHADRPYQPSFARWGIGCAFLRPPSRLAARLRTDGWRTRFADESWTVLFPPAGEAR
jgi:hypothetical protein